MNVYQAARELRKIAGLLVTGTLTRVVNGQSLAINRTYLFSTANLELELICSHNFFH